jgi:hypothetical protein
LLIHSWKRTKSEQRLGNSSHRPAGAGGFCLGEKTTVSRKRKGKSSDRQGLQRQSGWRRTGTTAFFKESDGDYPAAGWTVLAPDLSRPTDGIVLIHDPVTANVMARFYRVRVMR